MTAPEVKALDAEPTLPDPADMGPYSEGELQVVRAFYYGSPDACWMCSGEPFDPDEAELPVCGACAGEVNGRLLATLDETRAQLAAVQEGFAQANVRAAKAESDLAEARALLTTGAQALLASERELDAALARAERADGRPEPDPRPAPERDEAHLRQHTAPGWWQVWGADLCVALLKPEDMAAVGNYVADTEESPRAVLFADGRTVSIGADGALNVGRDDKRAREVFWSKRTRPEPEKGGG